MNVNGLHFEGFYECNADIKLIEALTSDFQTFEW